MAKTMTKREKFEAIVEFMAQCGIVEGEMVDFMESEIEKLSRGRKPSAVDLEKRAKNAEMTELIVAAMEVEKNYCVADIKEMIPDLSSASPQKVSSLMNAATAAGRLTKGKDRRVTVWSLA